MTQIIEGYLFPPRSSDRVPVRVSVGDDALATVIGDDGTVLLSAAWADLKISNRVGNTARRLTFPEGEVVETTDNDIVDAIEKGLKGTTTASLFHRMERLTSFTLLVLVVAGVLSFSFFKWWLPAAADRTAMALPAGLLSTIGDQSLKIMDKGFLEPSQLSAEQQDLFRQQFDAILKAAGPMAQTPELLFRSGTFVGPNAFAMPSGKVILTDEIIHLSTHDSQILGVLAHEISHVENRHVMRSFLRSTSIAVIIVLITGDMAELTEFAIAIPTFMIEMGYSRSFETEADARAVVLMNALGENPDHLADMFELLGGECEILCDTGWLSSHPEVSERIMRIRGSQS